MVHAISNQHPLILASSSRHRVALLGRLRVPFASVSPDIDETPKPNEAPDALAQRLAKEKAGAIAARAPDRWVLASDQVAVCNDRIFGKPGTRERAIEQLSLASGHSVKFITAVALVHRAGNRTLTMTDHTTVRFRQLAAAEIARYVDTEDVLDSAGSFKSEGLGISLCANIMSHDPTALIGLPLIGVRQLLMEAGFAIP